MGSMEAGAKTTETPSIVDGLFSLFVLLPLFAGIVGAMIFFGRDAPVQGCLVLLSGVISCFMLWWMKRVLDILQEIARKLDHR